MVNPNKVNVIPATKRAVQAGGQIKTAKALRVAAYGRVSTGDESQQTSYTVQCSYYTDLIRKNPTWKFAGMYADEAISGTSRAKRVQFNRMVEDAKAGKIDYIITKSISRFARNTVDTLSVVRELRNQNPPVGVYFEKENIDSMDSKGELILTILSALAQDESRSISDNIKWTFQKKFQEGRPNVNLKRMLGYDLGEDGETWVINEEQAKIVRFIYKSYIDGMSPGRIAAALNEQGILTVRGNKWGDSSVVFILGNEKYVGDLELQKTITVDFLNHKSVKNAGLAPKYYVENHHVGIIDRMTWDKVQAIREGKRKTQKARAEKSGNQVAVHPLSNLTCGDCGGEFRRYSYSGQAHNYEDERGCTKEEKRFYVDIYSYTYYVWRCYDKFSGRTKEGAFNKQEKALFDSRCPSKVLHEIAICQSFMEMLYSMKREYEELGEQSSFSSDFREAYEKVYQSCKGSDYTTQQMELLDGQIAELEEQYQIQVSKQVEALRNAVEDAGEESPDLGAAKIYADLAEEIKQKIDRCTEERSRLEDERGITVRMKKNYDLFIGCLLALPEENDAGWKLNVNGRDVDGSLFTEADGTPKERKLGLYNQGRLKMDAEKMMQAPDFLKFDSGMYSAFFPKAVVKGDVIEFTTNFGVKLVCRGVDRSLRGFYGFRRIREDGSVEIMTEHWQVADTNINYRRKKRKIVKNADDEIDATEADAVEAV